MKRLAGTPPDVPALKGDSARCRVLQAGDQAGKRGLPASRLADEADALPCFDRESHAVYGVEIARFASFFGPHAPQRIPNPSYPSTLADRELLQEVDDLEQGHQRGYRQAT